MIAERLADLRRKIAAFAEQAKRNPADIRLIGVCKFQPLSKIRAALEAGLQDLGQNYVQEIAKQAAGLGDRFHQANWHFVGALQRNKVKDLLQLFPQHPPLIHTLDRPALAHALEKAAASQNQTIECLIQVLPEGNVGDAPNRAGCPPEKVVELMTVVRDCPHVAICGLMILPPVEEDPEQSRRHFHFLRQLGATLQADVQRISCERICLREYSMGMTTDLREAVLEGATYVRVGTGLFGEREARP